LRVFLLLEAALGGAGRHVLDLAFGLLTQGHHVDLIYSPVRADQRFIEGLAELRSGNPHLRVTSLPIQRELGLSDVRWWWRISQHVRRCGPFDAIHCHSTKAGFLGRLGFGRRHARVVYTPHALMMLNPSIGRIQRTLVAGLERFLSGLCDKVVLISEAECRAAQKAGISRKKVVTIPNGVRTSCFQWGEDHRRALRARMGISQNEIAVGLVGRLCHDKNPELALDAFGLAVKLSSQPMTLVVMGDGLTEELRQRAANLNVAGSIRWLGPVDAPAHIPGLDLLLHSSRFEGLSYVFLECLAAGVPIVTTNVGGVEEVIGEGETGFVSASRNPEDLCAPLLMAVEDAALRKRMSEAAQARSRRFELDAMLDGVLKLYSPAT
jgi:glycosyltransferase involved in cell wall biosynthesis